MAPRGSLLLREGRLIVGKWQFGLICVSFLVLLWQPIKWIICLKRDGQVISSSAELCLWACCRLGSTRGRLHVLGSIWALALLHFSPAG